MTNMVLFNDISVWVIEWLCYPIHTQPDCSQPFYIFSLYSKVGGTIIIWLSVSDKRALLVILRVLVILQVNTNAWGVLLAS